MNIFNPCRPNYCITVAILIIFSGFLVQPVDQVLAQRVTYQDILQRESQSDLYIDHLTLPSTDSAAVNFVTTFRVNYNLLRFKKFNPPQSAETSSRHTPSFESSLNLSMELYSGEKSMTRKKLKNTQYQDLTPAARKFWKKQIFADTYEETRSNHHYVSGFMEAEVKPGLHRMLLQLSRGEGEETTKRTQIISISKPDPSGHLPFYYLDSLNVPDNPQEAALINYGDNVHYGQNFYLLSQLPSSEKDYTIAIQKINISEGDTSKQETVYKRELSRDNLLKGVTLQLGKDSTNLRLDITYHKQQGHSYALLEIPNSEFENGKYRVLLSDAKTGKVISRDIYQSHWIDMPVSLLSIDVSIRMLEYIIGEKKVSKMLEGSRDNRINKFRDFWEKKDPTPKTAYNELMAEYYQRIDRAFEKFSSINQPGFNTDMGKVYIRRGAPDQIERRFPSGERAVEMWRYPDKTYIFRATSGFGDFKLVSEK